jgi:hypothetical protein
MLEVFTIAGLELVDSSRLVTIREINALSSGRQQVRC